uniref:Transmembrane protein n=1 Tax=Cacopsylla melanoneura TaxID=428564 RepID=A0A8D9BKI9_9HEMI
MTKSPTYQRFESTCFNHRPKSKHPKWSNTSTSTFTIPNPPTKRSITPMRSASPLPSLPTSILITSLVLIHITTLTTAIITTITIITTVIMTFTMTFMRVLASTPHMHHLLNQGLLKVSEIRSHNKPL